jgi:hypothetical protein
MDPVWLPGAVEVHVVGESFHVAEIMAATRSVPPGARLTAVLVPQPDNPHDASAVAVHLNGYLAGHLPRQVAAAVQAALMRFIGATGGRPPACPADVFWHDIGPQVDLHLDPAPLRLPPGVFDHVPDLDQAIGAMLPRLQVPVPSTQRRDPHARDLLARAQAVRQQVEHDYDRSRDAWPRAERAFRDAAVRLEAAGDPLASDAWAGVAASVRYQKGRRDDRIAAAIEALRWNPANTDAWADLFDLASCAPHVPTLLAMYRLVPPLTRPPVLSLLISLSRGHDRLGNMTPDAGARLRAELTALAQHESDKASAAKLTRDARRHGKS